MNLSKSAWPGSESLHEIIGTRANRLMVRHAKIKDAVQIDFDLIEAHQTVGFESTP